MHKDIGSVPFYHREAIKHWLSTITLRDVSIVDWGAGTKPAINWTNNIGDIDYTSIDKLDHVGAKIVADIGNDIVLAEDFDVAFCVEVIEHVLDPDLLLTNIHANLKATGLLYLTAPFMFPIHHTEDYWRYTDQGINIVLERNGFQIIDIQDTIHHQGWMITAIKKVIHTKQPTDAPQV